MSTLLLLLVILKKHIDSKHKGVIYPCDKCEYAATRAEQLREHIKRKHERVRYPCEKCEYSTTARGYLKTHVERKHKDILVINLCEQQLKQVI